MKLLARSAAGRVAITPESAGWDYVGFEALPLEPGEEVSRDLAAREVCIVMLSGVANVRTETGGYDAVGGRGNPFDGPPQAVYLPPGGSLVLEAAAAPAEVALCFAPALDGAEPRLIAPEDVACETRGSGAMERGIRNILMGAALAERLLVTEVITPAGHWSSYPPHKHDRDDPPHESLLEETYYHRLRPNQGFGVQRVYTDDGSLDESVAFGDGDVVLVPRGYHTVSAPPGYELYYLNVMAGPRRSWNVTNDADHAWLAGA